MIGIPISPSEGDMFLRGLQDTQEQTILLNMDNVKYETIRLPIGYTQLVFMHTPPFVRVETLIISA